MFNWFLLFNVLSFLYPQHIPVTGGGIPNASPLYDNPQLLINETIMTPYIIKSNRNGFKIEHNGLVTFYHRNPASGYLELTDIRNFVDDSFDDFRQKAIQTCETKPPLYLSVEQCKYNIIRIPTATTVAVKSMRGFTYYCPVSIELAVVTTDFEHPYNRVIILNGYMNADQLSTALQKGWLAVWQFDEIAEAGYCVE